jgi:heat-inducible transcriptional repressor
MESNLLSERETLVLQALVDAYIEIGIPIGSQTLCAREDLGISSATVRNTLSSLEEKGYVEQPHTSAGRIPTDRGYRFFVAQRMEEGGFELDEEEIQLREQLEAQLREGNCEEILTQLAKMLGDISHQLGLVLAPRFEQGFFHRLELVRLAENRLLLVVTIRQGLVKSLVLEVASEISRDDLELMSRLLNERLHGLTMAEIRRSMRQRLAMLNTGNPQLLRAVTEEIEGLAAPSGADLHVSGTSNICLQPEFHDPFRVAGLIELVENKDALAHLLRARQGMVITIGEENGPQPIELCSVVTASCEIGGALGVIGVIGPMRMPYGRVVNLVNCAASRAAALVL